MKYVKNMIFTIVIGFLLLVIFVQSAPVNLVMNTVGFKPFVIMSKSMTGVYEVLDSVVVRSVDPEKLQVDDVITFTVEENGVENVYTHFVAEVVTGDDGVQIRTKSNVSERWDNWTVQGNNVIGKVWFNLPAYGVFMIGLKNPVIIAGVITTILMIVLVVSLLRDLIHDLDRNPAHHPESKSYPGIPENG